MGFMDKVKETAEKFGGAVEKGVKNGSDSYKKMAEKSKIKKEISRTESEITEAYADIGRRFVAENPASEIYADLYSTISEGNVRLESLKAQLMNLEDKVLCDTCGETVPKDAKFCPKCGGRINPPVITPESGEKASDDTEEKSAISDSGEIE